jgi:hypothetical protein
VKELLAEDTLYAEDFEDAAEMPLDGEDLREIAELEEREAKLWQQIKALQER